jgi:hypothetical protein
MCIQKKSGTVTGAIVRAETHSRTFAGHGEIVTEQTQETITETNTEDIKPELLAIKRKQHRKKRNWYRKCKHTINQR